ETKARTLLLQSLLEDHMADFHHLDDAKEIWLAVKARFGGNEESKKIRKTMLKQEFSEFSVSEEEGLHKGYDRFQKILSQLNQMQAKPDNDDVTIKFLRALPPSWSQVALTLKTRGGLEYLSFDDLYNKLRSFEIDVKGGSSGLTEMEELDIKCQMAMLSLRINKFQKKTRRKINFNNKDSARFDRRKARRYNYFVDHAGNAVGSVYNAAAEFAMMGISSKNEWEVKFVESLARFDKWKKSSKNLAKLKYSSMSTRTKLGLGFKEYIGSDEVCDLFTPSVFDPEPENREVKSLYERFVKAGKMHEVPPPITGTFMPTSYKSDLEETQATFGSKSNNSSINTSDSNDFVSYENSDKSSASKTYDFASCVSSPQTNDSFSTVDVKILPKFDVKNPSPTNGFPSCSFKKNVKPPRNLCHKSGKADRIHCKNNFVRTKKCFICGSKSHLIKDCDVYDTIDKFPSIISKATSVPAGSRNSSASTSVGRSIPTASRNRPASIHAGRHIHAEDERDSDVEGSDGESDSDKEHRGSKEADLSNKSEEEGKGVKIKGFKGKEKVVVSKFKKRNEEVEDDVEGNKSEEDNESNKETEVSKESDDSEPGVKDVKMKGVKGNKIVVVSKANKRKHVSYSSSKEEKVSKPMKVSKKKKQVKDVKKRKHVSDSSSSYDETIPSLLFASIHDSQVDMESFMSDVGFSSFHNVFIDTLPQRFTRFVVRDFSASNYEFKLEKGIIRATPDKVHEILGVHLGGTSIFDLPG
nr:ribonuclease H-like domain-containing protein [Tanacetum cinerariifolium]